MHTCDADGAAVFQKNNKIKPEHGRAREAVMRKAVGLHKNPLLSAVRLQHRGHLSTPLGENSFQERLYPHFDECEKEKKMKCGS